MIVWGLSASVLDRKVVCVCICVFVCGERGKVRKKTKMVTWSGMKREEMEWERATVMIPWGSVGVRSICSWRSHPHTSKHACARTPRVTVLSGGYFRGLNVTNLFAKFRKFLLSTWNFSRRQRRQTSQETAGAWQTYKDGIIQSAELPQSQHRMWCSLREVVWAISQAKVIFTFFHRLC